MSDVMAKFYDTAVEPSMVGAGAGSMARAFSANPLLMAITSLFPSELADGTLDAQTLEQVLGAMMEQSGQNGQYQSFAGMPPVNARMFQGDGQHKLDQLNRHHQYIPGWDKTE